MRKATIYLEEASVRSLQRLVSDYLSQYRRPRAKGIGMYSSGRSDISERAEELFRHAALDRKTGQRRDATRAPNQARNGWAASGPPS